MKDTPMNVAGIPRYKASPSVQTVFITNADGCGDHVFTQVARKGNVAVYRRNEADSGHCQGWETIVIKTVKAGTVYAKGATPTANDTESYPGSASFGKTGWSYPSLGAAMAKLEELTKEKVDSQTVGGPVLPQHDFTIIHFAKANNLPVDKGTAGILTGMMKEKKVKFLRTEMVNGKSIQYFGRV